MSGFFDIDVNSMRKNFANAMHCCLENQTDQEMSDDISPAALNDSMQQLFSIIETVDNPNDSENALLEQEMTELPNHCMGLLGKLCAIAQTLNCDESSGIFEQLSIPLALHFARHQLVMQDIELVANAISNTANHTQDPQQLAELADVIDVIVNMFSADIKADLDKSNPGRPWRIINMNQAIIATRSHDPKRMETVFEQLIIRLPDDAPGFFAEGMQQMDIIDYPQHVKNVMQTYYKLTNQPTLH